MTRTKCNANLQVKREFSGCRIITELAFVVILSLATPAISRGEYVYSGIHTSIYIDAQATTIQRFEATIGPMPNPNKDGSIQPVMEYLNENANDPSRMQFIRWSGVAPVTYSHDLKTSQMCWGLRVKMRGANVLGGLTVQTYVFLIRNSVVVHTEDFSPADLVLVQPDIEF